MRNRQEVINIIKAIQRQAAKLLNPNQTEGWDEAKAKKEAATFMERAAKLIAKHQISEDEITDVAQFVEDAPVGGLQFESAIKANFPQNWFKILCQSVSFSVAGVRFQFFKFNNNCVILGTEETATLAHGLLTILVDKAQLFYDTLKQRKADLKKLEYLLGFAAACLEGARIAQAEITIAENNKLIKIGNAIGLRVEALIKTMNQQGANSKPAEPVRWSQDSGSYTEGFHDGETKDNTRL